MVNSMIAKIKTKGFTQHFTERSVGIIIVFSCLIFFIFKFLILLLHVFDTDTLYQRDSAI